MKSCEVAVSMLADQSSCLDSAQNVGRFSTLNMYAARTGI